MAGDVENIIYNDLSRGFKITSLQVGTSQFK